MLTDSVVSKQVRGLLLSLASIHIVGERQIDAEGRADVPQRNVEAEVAAEGDAGNVEEGEAAVA